MGNELSGRIVCYNGEGEPFLFNTENSKGLDEFYAKYFSDEKKKKEGRANWTQQQKELFQKNAMLEFPKPLTCPMAVGAKRSKPIQWAFACT